MPEIEALDKFANHLDVIIGIHETAVVDSRVLARKLKDTNISMGHFRATVASHGFGWQWVPLTGDWYFYKKTAGSVKVDSLIAMISERMQHNDWLKVGMISAQLPQS